MNRLEQMARQQRVVSMYRGGEHMEEIISQSGYTRSMIYTILRRNQIETRRRRASDDPYIQRIIPGLVKLRPTAITVLARADVLESNPAMVVDGAELKRLRVTERVQARTEEKLHSLGLILGVAPHPYLYAESLRSYFPLTVKDMLWLHADTGAFLRENATRIRGGWLPAGENYLGV